MTLNFAACTSTSDTCDRKGLQDRQQSEPGTIVAFPMYDFEPLQRFNDEFWAAIKQRLVQSGIQEVPSQLTRSLSLDSIWLNQEMLLSQTCGYPLYRELRESVRVVATPKYSVPGCHGAFHRSFVVVRAEESGQELSHFRGRRCVINSFDSNSGANLLRDLVAPLALNSRFFESVSISGSHYASLSRVANGGADVAAIDCVTYAHLKRFDSALIERTKVIAQTVESPGLPLITAVSTPLETVLALQAALRDIASGAAHSEFCKALFLDGFEFIPQQEYYDFIAAVDERAISLGYPQLV
ncbi:MAG TPA: PhnD/SsuA/transferrin family substrate-binding protein [Oculatellaceae cyanobacterium]